MTRRMSTTRRARIFEVKCAICGSHFDRGYRISRARAAQPQYCSKDCQAEAAKSRHQKPVAERFWQKVEQRGEDDCWPWKGCVRPNGYGWFHLGRKPMNASRAAYILTHNVSLKSTDYVCHTCDNPQCCNPAHLWLGDVASNTRDMDKKGRRMVSPRVGQNNHNSRLSAQIARDIISSIEPDSVLAKRYGVTASAIYNVRKGKAWAHATGVSK